MVSQMIQISVDPIQIRRSGGLGGMVLRQRNGDEMAGLLAAPPERAARGGIREGAVFVCILSIIRSEEYRTVEVRILSHDQFAHYPCAVVL